MNDFENNWKNKMDNPEAFDGFIPADTKDRIENQLFPPASKRIIPFWLSHAAAVVVGILMTGLGFYMLNDSDSKPVSNEVMVQTIKDTVYLELPKEEQTEIVNNNNVATPATPKAVQTYKTKETPIPPKPIVVKSIQLEVENEQPIEDYPLQNPIEPARQEKVIAKQHTKKVVPVSDIAPVRHKMPFAEKITRPMMAQQNIKNEKSPFKFINN